MFTVLELAPAMPSKLQPDWAGARWVGSLDLTQLNRHNLVHSIGSHGYTRARLLIREGARVRGFVDVAVRDGFIDRAELDREVSLLPAAEDRHAAPTLPLVTVVICTRDRAEHLRLALKAVLNLDYPHFEVLVVDNASATTATSDLVRDEFSDPRVVLVAEPKPGLATARNTGLVRARGDIVAFTDDDVIVDGAWLRELVAGFKRAPGVACVSGLVPSGELRTRVQGYFDDRVSWSRNVKPMVYSLAAPPAELPLFPFSIGQFGTGANFALRRSIAIQLGGFDTAFGVGTPTGGGEDIDMFTRVILGGHVLVMQPSAIVWHRHRDDVQALRVQARGYGTGLGAWLTKILLHPRTLAIAWTRSPHAIARLVSLAWREPDVPVARESLPRGEFGREIARVGWLELLSVAKGPLRYAMQRHRGAGLLPLSDRVAALSGEPAITNPR